MDRILIRNGSTIEEISHYVNEFTAPSKELTITDSTEIYIGKELPFNHLYFNFDSNTENSISSLMNIEYWDGSQFRDVANKVDETYLEGASFGQNGFVIWTPDKDYGWRAEDTEQIAELETVKYYNMYWNRISFSASLSADVAIKYIGQMFCTDNELYSEFYQFSETDWLEGFQVGKTDWVEQCIVATDLIVNKLKSSAKILTKDQLLSREGLRDVAVQKTAEIIYNRFGEGRKEERIAARDEANLRFKDAIPRVDKELKARANLGQNRRVVHWRR